MAEQFAIPRLWDGATAVVIACGPSLDLAQVRTVARARASGAVRAIAVNDAVYPAWWADVLYACDAKWWRFNGGVPGFSGLKIGLEPVPEHPEVNCAAKSGDYGFDPDPRYLRTGSAGGHQAVCAAVHLGAARVVLLGFDCTGRPGRLHWHGDHPQPLRNPQPQTFEKWLRAYDALAPELGRRGIDVINATPGSAIAAFRKLSLEEALACR